MNGSGRQCEMYKVWQQQKVAVTLQTSCFKQRRAEKSTQEAGIRNVIITDKHRLKIAERVSRNSREEKTEENFGGDYDFFQTSGTKKSVLRLGAPFKGSWQNRRF